MTANASSSLAESPVELSLELASSPLLNPLAQAFLAGRDLDLLAPLRFVSPGGTPAGGAGKAPDRQDLARALGAANRAYGNPNADRWAARLADPATRLVVTGQQPGLFGGPLYAFSKMIAAARWAEALEAGGGGPAVALFWVATEDHDWAEVSQAVVQAQDGPRTFDLGEDPEPLAPVGMRSLGPRIDQALAGMAEAVPGDRWADWLRTLGRWYRPDARFGEAFCRVMAAMLGERCPLLVDSMLPELKAAQRPWLRRLVEGRAQVDEALRVREEEIARRGYPLQVTPQRGASPLFLLHRGERRRIEWDGAERFTLRGRPEAGGRVEDLLALLDDNPGLVSPGVLARPAVQDAVFGTALELLGPGELAYMAQSSAVHAFLGVPPAEVVLRPHVVVLAAHLEEKLAESGLTLADLHADPQDLDRALATRSGGDFVTPVRDEIDRLLGGLQGPALEADPNLERPLEKTREQVLRALDTFRDKALAAAARRNEVASRRAQQLREVCLPLGRLQERTVSAASFYGRHGEELTRAFWEQMRLDPSFLEVIRV